MIFYHLKVLLSSHIRSQEALDCEGCVAHLQVAPPCQPHSHVALNDHSCSGLSKELDITDRKQKENKGELV